MTDTFLSAIKNRRSYYSLSNGIAVTPERIKDIVEQVVLATPSAFNSQSQRVVVLFGEQHAKLWNINKEVLRGIVPADAFAATEEKIDSFAAAAGTILYYDETTVTKGLQEQYPLYSDNFPIWAQQSNGMLQSNIWNALEAEGLGASLQHYNPLIDEKVADNWKLPASWKLIAQMPFGKITAPAAEKDILPASERVTVFR
ncbi:nitroreductase [Clostridia bacterium]|nr:nitroreductase [Clostridia bacterium]